VSEMLRTRGSRVLILIAYLDFDRFPTLGLAFILFLLLLNTVCLTTGIWTVPRRRWLKQKKPWPPPQKYPDFNRKRN
jgi:hypothetical protein